MCVNNDTVKQIRVLMMGKFDYKTKDLFTGDIHRPKKGTIKADRDPDAVDLFLGDTDRESGRPVVRYNKPIPSVADVLGINQSESGD